jgi:hypothetical protein
VAETVVVAPVAEFDHENVAPGVLEPAVKLALGLAQVITVEAAVPLGEVELPVTTTELLLVQPLAGLVTTTV